MKGHKPAGFWIRFLAAFIDGILTSIIAWIVAVLINDQNYFNNLNFSSGNPSFYTTSEVLSNLIYGVVFIIIFTASHFRGSPGKLICRIQVLNPDMTQISIPKSIGRYFARILSTIPLLIGFMMAGWNREKKALHDIIASTRVVYKQKDDDKEEEIQVYE